MLEFEPDESRAIAPLDARRNGSNGWKKPAVADPAKPKKKPAAMAIAKPKLKKYEACAALVEVLQLVEEKFKHASECLTDATIESDLIRYYRRDAEKYARWLAALEMAATGLTR